MTTIPNLTEEQQTFARHVGGVFVNACPGAGKTRTIIARLVRIAEILPPRHGVAVLSFTNSAVDEFRERCKAVNLESLLRHPSYMGTLDAFVRHFLVLPGCVTLGMQRPLILESWESLGVDIHLSGLNAFRGPGVSLDLFDPETNIVNLDTIGHPQLKTHVRQHQLQYQQAAATRRRNLINAGYLSTADARTQTLKLIRDPLRGPALARALSARFYEVIVDEGQDCNPLDMQILSWLREYGVNVTFVCDPNQAIYGFRYGNPAGLVVFEETFSAEFRHTLSGNFRSSPAICQLASTLRGTGNVDQAVGDSRDISHPILLLSYNGPIKASIGEAFLSHIATCGFSQKSIIILAHAGKVAQEAAGSFVEKDSVGTSHVEGFAQAVAKFWSVAARPRSRENALQMVEGQLLDLMGIRHPNEHVLKTLQRTGIDGRSLRRKALTLLMNIPRTCDDTDEARIAWILRLHSKVEELLLEVQPEQTIRGFFRKPPNGRWSSHLRAPIELGLDWSTIHEAKGHEYDGVCVVIPPNKAPSNRTALLMDAWENKTDDEAKRVIYVGVTRGRKVVALAVPTAYSDRCEALFQTNNVPYVLQILR